MQLFRGESLSRTRPVSHSVGQSHFSSYTLKMEINAILMVRIVKIVIRIVKIVVRIVRIVTSIIRIVTRMFRMVARVVRMIIRWLG